LRGKGLARIGAGSDLLSGPYALSQASALALHHHPSAPGGIVYRARHDPEQASAAIFGRAEGVVAAMLLGSFADVALARLLAELLDRYDFGLV
jgi:hypothetical protein